MRRAVKALVPATALLLVGATAAMAAVSDTPRATASVNGIVRDVLVLGNTVYVAGLFDSVRGPSGSTYIRHNVAAFNASTGAVKKWDPNADDQVYALAALDSGQIALGGVFNTVGSARHRHLAVVSSASGTIKTSFTASANGKVRALAVGTNGWLYVGGTFTSISGQPSSGLAAFDGNTFTLEPWVPQADGGAVLTLDAAKGLIFVGGKFTSLGIEAGSGYLDGLDPKSGAIRWNPSTSIPVHDVAVGKTSVYVAADGKGGHLYAYNLSGAGRKWTVTTDGGVQAVAVIGTDVYFGGHFDNVGSTHLRKLAVATTTGTLQSSWAPQANSNQGVFVLAKGSNSSGSFLVAGGAFTTFDGGIIKQAGYAEFQ